jgi:flagellar protein FliS
VKLIGITTETAPSAEVQPAPAPIVFAPQRAAAPLAQDRAAQLNRDAVLSATPVRLLTMLYDRLLLDLGRAEQAQQAENWPVASEQLQHAQAILTELSGSLRLDVWDGADGLLALYTYVTNALVLANIHRDVARTREAIALLEPLRAAWHDAAAILPAQQPSPSTGALGIA